MYGGNGRSILYPRNALDLYTAIAVCQFDVRAPVMPAQTRHRALSHRKVSIINLILSKEGMRAKETVHDNQK